MLNAMRSKVSGLIAKVLMGLLIVSFAIWGIGDFGTGGPGSFVASVGSERISMTEFQRQVRLFTRAAEAAGITNPDPELLQRQMLRRIIEEKLAELALYDTGLAVGDTLLARELRQAPALQKPDGTFDDKAFHIMLQQRQINEAGFLDQLKIDLTNQTLIESISAGEMALPASYLALNARAASQTRDAVIVTIPAASAAAETPDEEDLKEYYEQQKHLLYLQPERRTLEYATITAADIAAMVAKEKDTTPEEARDRAMQAFTDRIEDALAAGKKMGEALKEAGLHPTIRQLRDVTAEGGADELTRTVVAEGFRLGEGETSNLEVAKGGTYFLVTVGSVTPASPKPFDAVRADLTKRLVAEARRDAVTLQAQAVMQALRTNRDWRTVLTEHKLNGQPMSNITRTGGGTLPIPLRQAIFEFAPGEAAGPLPMPNGDAMLAIVTAVRNGTGTTLNEATRKRLAEDLNQEVFAQYFNHLAQRYPVTVNDTLFTQTRKDAE